MRCSAKYICIVILFIATGILLNSCATKDRGAISIPINLPRPAGELQKPQVVKKYLGERDLDLIEGIWVWDDNSYEVAIIKNSFGIYHQYDYIGIITDSRQPNWRLGEVKLLLKKTLSDNVYPGIYFLVDKSEYGTSFSLPNENTIVIGLPTNYGSKKMTMLLRTYPQKVTHSKSSMQIASDLTDQQKSLKGLKSISVIVRDIAPDARQDGLTTEKIETDVKLRLRKAGIRLNDKHESGFLYVLISTVKSNQDFYIVNCSVQFVQNVRLERDSDISIPGCTWLSEQVGIIQLTNISNNLSNFLASQVESFINDYLAANPKK